MKSSFNLLFTSVGRRVELLRAFRRAYQELGVSGRIVAIDADPLAPALRVADRSYQVPALSDQAYLPTLRRILERERVDVVFPLIDPDIPVLARNRADLETTHTKLAVVPAEAASIASDKWETFQFFRRLGIATPISFRPDQEEISAPFPLFIKPRLGSASQHAFRVEDARQLTFFCDYIADPIVQEYLLGPEITTDVVCGLDGRILSAVSRQRIKVRGGEVVIGKTVFDRALMEECIKIAYELGAVGPITIQCVMSSGGPKFTEINARFGGGLPLGIAAGADSPRLFLAHAVGMPVDVPPLGSYRCNVYLSRFDDSFFQTGNDLERPTHTPPVGLAVATDARAALGEARSRDKDINQGQRTCNGAPPKRIYLSPPHMGPDERELLLEAFDSNWIAYLGPQVDAFEREFAEKLGVKEAVAVTSGTAALHLALLSLRVGPGDEVATSSFTFAASANVIRYVGATPVFIDCERQSWNLDPQLLAEELESGARRGRPLKAVLAVDVCGQCADYEHLLKVCRFYNVPLIEDAAQALGARYGGRAAGAFGEIGCFSFNGNKIITTGGGGMLVTNRTDLANRARFLSTQAREPAPHYEHAEIGYNYRLSNLLAAVGRGQLRLLEDRIARRRANFQFYQRELGDLRGIAFMPEPAPNRASRWLTCITIDPQQFGASAEELRLAFEAENIESRRLWKPMHLQTAFAGCRVRGGSVSEQLFREGLSLPSGSNLREDELRRVIQVIRRIAGSGAIESMPAAAVEHGGPGRSR